MMPASAYVHVVFLSALFHEDCGKLGMPFSIRPLLSYSLGFDGGAGKMVVIFFGLFALKRKRVGLTGSFQTF